MSDKTNYQEMRLDPHPTQQMVDACCARIAELEVELTLARPAYSRRQLEAENTELRKQNEILTTTRRLEEEARKQAEAALAERERMLDTIRATIVARKQEAALYGDKAEWEGLSVALRVIDDLRARAEEAQGA